MSKNNLIVKEDIKHQIHAIRGIQVMLDSDLAELYGVPTKVLNQAVKRNIDRFPEDFMFQLTSKEFEILVELTGNASIDDNRLRSQFATSSLNKNEEILRSQFATTNSDNSSNLPTNISNNANRLISQFVISSLDSHKETKKTILKSQFVTSSLEWGGKRKLPFVFTEQGVAMLSGVLKSERAVYINIFIMRAFVSMRRFIHKEAAIFARLDNVEKKELEDRLEIKQIKNNTAKDFEKIFETIEDRVDIKKHQIFFDGQVFDAYKFVNDILKNAKKSIILIDNYIDESVLILFSELKNVKVTIYTENLTEKLKLDLEKYNQQYPKIEIKTLKKCHDRFLIIDNKEIYYIGASIKDLGKKWFAFSKMDKESLKIVSKLG